jgi:hypothetical protein
MKKTVIADVVLVNSVMWAVGGKGVREARAKGGAVVTRQGTRVDGNSSLRVGS